VEELEHLLLAALTAGECPNLSLTTVSPEAKKLAKELKKKLHPGSYERLRAASRSFRTDRMPERAAHWLKTVELAGGRAGLLACGDVAVAADLVRKHPLSGLTLGQDQVADIMCFSVSAEYATLRGRLGVAIA
jgi:hypothetical protein